MTYIQIGTTALRDPVTGCPLESVPLFIRAEDQVHAPAAIDSKPVTDTLCRLYKTYKERERCTSVNTQKKNT